MKRIFSVIALLAISAAISAQSGNYHNDSLYTILQDVKIPMKDGIKLSAYVIRHKQDTMPMPVMLMISCYPSVDEWRTIQYYLRKGVAGVLVHARGKASSEGVFEPFEHEATDNYEVIDWISKQSWCNGSIGMYGGSYLGFTQWAACKKMHPALKTIVPLVAAAPGIDYPMHNNVFMSYMLRWINYTTNNKMSDNANFADAAYWRSLYTKKFHAGTFLCAPRFDGWLTRQHISALVAASWL